MTSFDYVIMLTVIVNIDIFILEEKIIVPNPV